MATLLVTTGATVTFKDLVQYVLLPETVLELSGHGIRDLVIQYGNEVDKSGKNVSKHHFDSCSTDLISDGYEHETLSDSGKEKIILRSSKITILAFPFAHDIEKYIRQADIVVSHAGTGSILDVLRLHKSLIVVTNDKLLNNHQLEVSLAMSKEGYLIDCSLKELREGKLIQSVGDVLGKKLTFKPLPEQNSDAVETILAEEF